MIKPGHIRLRIDRKVYFEYYELKPPGVSLYYSGGNEYYKQMDKYKASKQLIEVSNIKYKVYVVIDSLDYLQRIKNNQPCKAEVTGETCTIAELN